MEDNSDMLEEKTQKKLGISKRKIISWISKIKTGKQLKEFTVRKADQNRKSLKPPKKSKERKKSPKYGL